MKYSPQSLDKENQTMTVKKRNQNKNHPLQVLQLHIYI